MLTTLDKLSIPLLCCCRRRGLRRLADRTRVSGVLTTPERVTSPPLEDSRAARLWLIPHPLRGLLLLPPEVAAAALRVCWERLVTGHPVIDAPRAAIALPPPPRAANLADLDDHVLQRIMAFCCGPSLCRLRATTRAWSQLDSEALYARLLLVEFGLQLSSMRPARGRPPPTCRAVYLNLVASRGAVFSDSGVSPRLLAVLQTGLQLPRQPRF